MSGNVFDHLRQTYFQECAELLDRLRPSGGIRG